MSGFRLPSAHQISLLHALPLTRHQVRDGWHPIVVRSLEAGWLMEWTEEGRWEITELGRLVTAVTAMASAAPLPRASIARLR